MNLDGKVLQGEETEQKTKYWPQCIAHTYIYVQCVFYICMPLRSFFKEKDNLILAEVPLTYSRPAGK